MPAGRSAPTPAGAPAESVARVLLGGLLTYAKIGWWGLVGPRLEREPLVVLQGVILAEEGILLAVRADLRGWELPGGTHEAGESFSEGLRREILEETGLEVAVERHVGDYLRTGFRPHLAKVYRCTPVRGALTVQEGETRELRWFRPDALPATLFPWYCGPVADALADRPGPVTIEERQGAAAVLSGLIIDFRMRLSNDKAGIR